MAALQFKPLNDTSINYQGKYVRYAGKFAKKMSSYKGTDFMVQPGTIGLCYSASIGVLHVGFKELKTGVLPDRGMVSMTSVSNWPYHIGLTPQTESGWEIEA